VADTVMGDAAKLCPIAQCSDGRLLASWENAALAQADDVG